MIDQWKYGLEKGFISDVEAKDIVGITLNGNKSTASRFKFGKTYFVPSLKIHKVKPEDLKPGCDIPVRLITCLQQGVTKRSDVYTASKWLKDLETDYCNDLVKDTNASLKWLEDMNGRTKHLKRKFSPFTFDFKSLYDSLEPPLVLKALRAAMDTCRSNWSRDFKDWIIDLVQLSIDASIEEFDGKFYKQKNGLPTGGSLIVPIANITVFYALYHTLYSNKNLMNNIVDIKRYIDDGVGIHCMRPRAFQIWKKTVTTELHREFHLTIEESDWNVPTEDDIAVNFLDI